MDHFSLLRDVVALRALSAIGVYDLRSSEVTDLIDQIYDAAVELADRELVESLELAEDPC